MLFVIQKKKGQIQSIVDTYKLVKTPYIFHCEDDWVYKRGNFVEESLKFLLLIKRLFKFGWRARKVLVGWIFLALEKLKPQDKKLDLEKYIAKMVGNGDIFHLDQDVLKECLIII